MSTSPDGLTGEVATSLHRGTNWWGAFVIGLAGTILVTGIVPFAAQSMGAASVPAITLVVLIGLVLCFCMAELAAMLPHRTGGLPADACDSYKPLGETTARHVGGLSGWGYWLGWFPVAPINMILAVLIITLGTPRSPSPRRDCTGSSCTSAPRWCSSACSVPRSRPSTR
jgi:amino acid transporter